MLSISLQTAVSELASAAAALADSAPWREDLDEGSVGRLYSQAGELLSHSDAAVPLAVKMALGGLEAVAHGYLPDREQLFAWSQLLRAVVAYSQEL